jgi:hypothetical protein
MLAEPTPVAQYSEILRDLPRWRRGLRSTDLVRMTSCSYLL